MGPKQATRWSPIGPIRRPPRFRERHGAPTDAGSNAPGPRAAGVQRARSGGRTFRAGDVGPIGDASSATRSERLWLKEDSPSLKGAQTHALLTLT